MSNCEFQAKCCLLNEGIECLEERSDYRCPIKAALKLTKDAPASVYQGLDEKYHNHC